MQTESKQYNVKYVSRWGGVEEGEGEESTQMYWITRNEIRCTVHIFKVRTYFSWEYINADLYKYTFLKKYVLSK